MEWTIICNVKDYDVEGAFNKLPKIDWKQSTGIEVNDIVYIYVGIPVQAIAYKCLATKVNLSEADIDDSEFVLDGTNYESYGRYMELELLEKYDDKRLGLNKLKENGFKSVQGPSRVTTELSSYLFSITETGGTNFDPYLPKGLIKKTRRDVIIILQRAFNRPVTARELTDLMYQIGKHQSAVFTELRAMEDIGLLKRTGSQQQFYFQPKDQQATPNYFYVFQNRTFKQEASGQYLWAPQKAKDGSENHHWSRMKQVKKGDVIFHGYKQHVAAVSIAKADAYSGKRPKELSNEWDNEGWRIDADYYIFPHAIQPLDYWNELKELQPDKYAPFDKNGNENTGYLYELNQKMARFILAATGGKQENDTEIGEYDSELESLLHGQTKEVTAKLIKQFNKKYSTFKTYEKQLEELRIQFVEDYKMQVLMHMTKEQYAVGKGDKATFCYRLENELKDLGNIHGSTSVKFGLYFGKSGEDTEEKYRFVKKFGKSADEAMANIDKQIVWLLMAGEANDFSTIRDCTLSPLLRGKILSVFYPEKFLNIFSEEHLDYFLLKLEIEISDNDDILDKQQKLVDWQNQGQATKDWTLYLFSRFLYSSFGRPFELNKDDKILQDERDKKYSRDYVTKIGITISQWKELLHDTEIFTEADVVLLKRFYIADNHATTCYDLGIKDGVSPSFYIKPIVALARRIADKMKLDPIYDDDGKQIWWRILFWGCYREDNHFEWKLRPKLAKALASLFPELESEQGLEHEEQQDNVLVEELKQASLNGLENGFEYNGTPKKKQAPVYTNGHRSYPRDRQTAINALAHANYLCEIENNHPTFMRKKSDKNYTEPHHLVPMSYSDKFDVSLDVEENIVSLCSNCHNQIHYGRDADILLKELYDARKKELERVGIIITLEQLLKMYAYHA